MKAIEKRAWERMARSSPSIESLIAHERDALKRAAELVESHRGESIVTSSMTSIRVEWPNGMDALLNTIAYEIRALKEEDSNVQS
jgi:hypothetical protein